MSALLPWVLSAMQTLAPARDHQPLASAVSARVEAEAPLFAGDTDRHMTAAWLVAIAFRESSLRLDAVGDHGKSFCAFQIHESAGGTRALLTDADACVAKAFDMLRTSLRVCPQYPLAWYASGPGGCTNARAHRVSNDRMWLAKKLVREVVAPTSGGAFYLTASAIQFCATASQWRRRAEGTFSARLAFAGGAS